MRKQSGEDLDDHIQISPIENPWGIQTCDPNPLAALSLFFWFKTEDELRDSLLAGGHATGADEAAWEKTRPAVEAALAKIDVLSPEAAESLNASIDRTFEIEWIGHFSELCSGSSKSAVMLRESFWDLESDNDVDRARLITPDDVDEFADHVKDFGC